MAAPSIPNLDEMSANAAILIKWLQEQDGGPTAELAQLVFDQLLAKASQPLQASVLQSCTKLCGYVQKAAKSGDPVLEDWAFKETTALKLFDFYMEWNEQDQHRSMRLVLDLLSMLIAKNPDRQRGAQIKEKILRSLVSIIARKSNRPLIKSCMSSLQHLLSKSVCNLDELAHIYRDEQPDVAELPNLALWGHFVREIFSWLGLQQVRTIAGRLIVTLLKSIRETATLKPDDSAWQEFQVGMWHQWLLESVIADPELLESVKLYVFLPLFKLDRTGAIELLRVMNQFQSSDSEYNADDTASLLHLAALDVGKQEGLVEEQGSASTKSTVLALDEDILGRMLAHRSSVLRGSALSLLVSSVSLSKPFSGSTIGLLKRYLPMYHSDSDPKMRNDVLSHTRAMTKRLKGSLAVLRRKAGRNEPVLVENGAEERIGKGQTNQKSAEPSATLELTLADQEEFLTWYLAFLKSELGPTTSYQRHVTALKATTLLLTLPKNMTGLHGILDIEMGHLVFQDFAWIRVILDCILDPFDDVRETAASLLMLIPPSFVSEPFFARGDAKFSLADTLGQFCERADKLASMTGRADHADGAARAQGILCSWAGNFEDKMSIVAQKLEQLERKLTLAKSDLGRAAIENPVHGDFAALRYIWEVLIKSEYSQAQLEQLSSVQVRIFGTCKRIWNLVQHVLCDDSPEGHLPEEMEDVEGLDTKDLLSYSFRAVHESSNTLRMIISTLRGGRADGKLLPSTRVFRDVGALSFEQMATLRHRGAFSRISQTFTTCCQLAQDPEMTPPNFSTESLLVTWYKGTLGCIYSQASTTRRSAGIPSLMTGILAANAVSPSFEDVMVKLASIAQEPARISETDGSNLPQVHALNCLRDVFRSSLLSKRAEPHLGDMLQLAADSLKSEVWAIRNCGLLLLRSLIDCLFGTESKADIDSGWDGRTMRLSYLRYPSLPGVLLSLLKAGQHASDLESQQAAAQSVFPALDIIRRAGPPDAAREELYSCIVEYLGSHLWHVRDMAARTVCSFLINQDWATSLCDLLEGAKGSSNRLHGVLLASKEMVVRAIMIQDDNSIDNILRFRDRLQDIFSDIPYCRFGPENQAAYHAVLNSISKVTTIPSIGPTYDECIGLLASTPEFKPPPALLQQELMISALRKEEARKDQNVLNTTWFMATGLGGNIMTTMLESIPSTFSYDSKDPKALLALCDFYITACCDVNRPEVCVPALENLIDALEQLLQLENSPSETGQLDQRLADLWTSLHQGPMNPALSQAIIRVTGPILAYMVLRENVGLESTPLRQKVSGWCLMMSEAGHSDNTFDTRFAAAQALRSYAQATKSTTPSHTLSPSFALTLYDALNDDDDEIRDEAAIAVSAVLGQPYAPLAAADAWLQWMADDKFNGSQNFRAAIVSRMIGAEVSVMPEPTETESWISAELQLRSALEFDDALFVVEEQNLFIDEVRETKRWAAVLAAFLSEYHQASDTAFDALRRWVEAGLRFLIQLTGEEGVDGPLGWTSKPEVYAICARVLLSANAVMSAVGDQVLVDLLMEFEQAGEKVGMHGGLLAMARPQESI